MLKWVMSDCLEEIDLDEEYPAYTVCSSSSPSQSHRRKLFGTRTACSASGVQRPATRRRFATPLRRASSRQSACAPRSVSNARTWRSGMRRARPAAYYPSPQPTSTSME